MTKISSFFIRRPKITNLVLLLIVIAGLLSINDVQKQGYPSVDFDIMKIETEYPGASPEDVEINVTDPIEDELENVEDIDELKSLSMENLSMVFVYVNPDAKNIDKVKDDVREAVNRVTDFPEEVTKKPRVEEITSTSMPIIEIAVYGNASETELRQIAKDLETTLRNINGIGAIEKLSYRKKEIHIDVKAEEIFDKYVSLSEIMDSIKSRNVRTSGGSLESYVTEKKIVTFSEYTEPHDVKDVIIRSTFTGNRLVVSDIAEIKDGFEEPNIKSRANGEPCIALLIKQQANADIVKISKNVKDVLKDFQKNLPEGIEAKLIFDSSIYTTSLLNMVRSNGIIGFILVLVVMFVFLDWKSAVWTAFGIPIAMCGAFILFKPFDVTVNVISLSAMILVLGMLVDDAIVIAENIYRLKEEGMKPLEATLQGVKEVFWPVMAAVLTTVFAFLPMLFMTGLIGKFIYAIPIVVTLMLVFSLIESTCFLPCHLAHSVPPKEPPKRTRWIPHAIAFYEKIVGWSLEHRKLVLIVFIGSFILVNIVCGRFIKFVLFPQDDPDILNIIIEAPKGTPLDETEEKLADIEKIVDKTVPREDMESYISRIGHHDTDVYGGTSGQYENWALITIYLKPAEEREGKSEDLIVALENKFKGMSEFERIEVVPMDDGPPVGKPVTIIYTSDKNDIRNKFETDTVEFLKNIDGIEGVESTNIKGKDELRLRLDYDTLARLGLTALDVSRTVRAAYEGEVATSIRREGEEIDFRVRLKDPKKYRAEDVLELLIRNQNGKLVPLKNFAHFDEAEAPAVIHHFDAKRSVTITAEVDNDKITAVEANDMVRKKFEPLAAEHPGLMIEFGGEEKKTQESMRSFYTALIIALIAIYFLLVVIFNSYTQPVLIMIAIPFALTGVVLTFLVHGLPLGFIAMIGILGLVGVVVNDTIVMVSHLNESCGGEGKTPNSVIKGAARRFRPVILTTLTTVAGLMPTAYGIGGDLPFIRPMVLAMAWGLIFATLVTLILIPVLYSLHARIK